MVQWASSSFFIGTTIFLSHHDIREQIAGLENRLFAQMNQRPKLESGGRGVSVCLWVLMLQIMAHERHTVTIRLVAGAKHLNIGAAFGWPGFVR